MKVDNLVVKTIAVGIKRKQKKSQCQKVLQEIIANNPNEIHLKSFVKAFQAILSAEQMSIKNLNIECLLSSKRNLKMFLWLVDRVFDELELIEMYEMFKKLQKLVMDFIIARSMSGPKRCFYIFCLANLYPAFGLLIYFLSDDDADIRNFAARMLALYTFNQLDITSTQGLAMGAHQISIKILNGQFEFDCTKIGVSDPFTTLIGYARKLLAAKQEISEKEMLGLANWVFASANHLFRECKVYLHSPVRYHVVSNFILEVLRVYDSTSQNQSRLLLRLVWGLIAGSDDSLSEFHTGSLRSNYSPFGNPVVVMSVRNILAWLRSSEFQVVRAETIDLIQKMVSPRKSASKNYALLKLLYNLVQDTKCTLEDPVELQDQIQTIITTGKQYHGLCFMENIPLEQFGPSGEYSFVDFTTSNNNVLPERFQEFELDQHLNSSFRHDISWDTCRDPILPLNTLDEPSHSLSIAKRKSSREFKEDYSLYALDASVAPEISTEHSRLKRSMVRFENVDDGADHLKTKNDTFLANDTDTTNLDTKQLSARKLEKKKSSSTKEEYLKANLLNLDSFIQLDSKSDLIGIFC
jgi:hypothetical protein